MTEPQTGAVTETEPETAFADLEVDAPLRRDHHGLEVRLQEMEKAGEILEPRRASATRSASCRPTAIPRRWPTTASNARMRGLRVIIAGAGLSAALPGVAAAHSDLPVIGVPLSSRLSALGGLDAILSIAQMPPGVPVACVGLDNARNAGHLAAADLRAA